jgi:hypothetical protein
MPHRRGLPPSKFGALRGRDPGSRTAEFGWPPICLPRIASPRKNENPVIEPDELLKTSHLKSDKTPILMSL